MATHLAAGAAFPATAITLSDGSTVRLPQDMGDGWKIVLFFRGQW